MKKPNRDALAALVIKTAKDNPLRPQDVSIPPVNGFGPPIHRIP